mgnify:CR=1 FL=1
MKYVIDYVEEVAERNKYQNTLQHDITIGVKVVIS